MAQYIGQIAEQALLIFPMVLGMYLSFSIIRIADMTVDGSFVLGAAVFAKCIEAGWGLCISLFAAVLSGFLAGALVALVQRKNRIDPLIAGILMAFVLHSLSLIIMQRPNIGLNGSASILGATLSSHLIILGIITLALSFGLAFFLSSLFGLKLKAFGNNQILLAMHGINPEYFRIFALAVSNGLVAFSGALVAQANGYADINMGFGQALIAIAMILVGRQLLSLLKEADSLSDFNSILFTFIGVFLYFILTNEVIRLGLSPMYLKMAIGGLLIIFLSLSSDKSTKRQRPII